MQNAVCSGCSMKISPQEETAESTSPSRGFHQAQQNPLWVATICITICCCLSGTQEWDTFRENTTCFSGAHYREGDCRSVCGGWEERTLPHFSITLPNEINETLLVAIFSILAQTLILFLNMLSPHIFIVCFAFIFGEPPNSNPFPPFPVHFTILSFHPGHWLGMVPELFSQWIKQQFGSLKIH